MIGKNNAGKSSIIKFLLMLQQSLSNYATHYLEPEGEKVHLGAFAELKNKRGQTALDAATEVGSSKTVQLLREAGAKE